MPQAQGFMAVNPNNPSNPGNPQYGQPLPPVYGSQPQSPSVAPGKKPRKIWLWIVLGVVAVAVVISVVVILINVLGPHDTGTSTPASQVAEVAPQTTQPEAPAEQPATTETTTPDTTNSSSGASSDSTSSTADNPNYGTLVGSWSNIMTEGGYATAEFTEDGNFTLVGRDGTAITGTYAITSGDITGGTVLCSVGGTDMTLEGDFTFNGDILTWGSMMFTRTS